MTKMSMKNSFFGHVYTPFRTSVCNKPCGTSTQPRYLLRDPQGRYADSESVLNNMMGEHVCLWKNNPQETSKREPGRSERRGEPSVQHIALACGKTRRKSQLRKNNFPWGYNPNRAMSSPTQVKMDCYPLISVHLWRVNTRAPRT